jgi:diguanylate cyclase (GGDEF)-like protein
LTPTPANLALRDTIVRTAVVAAVAVGVAALVGWGLGVRVLESVVPGWATMKASTAAAIVSAGASLWLLQSAPLRTPGFLVGRVLAGLVGACGALFLAQDLVPLDLGPDLARAPDTPLAAAWRMSPATAFSLVSIAAALLALRSPLARLAALTPWLVSPALLVAVLAVAGYACDAGALYAIAPYSTMAVNTAGALLILAIGVLAADSQHGLAAVAFGDTAGGRTARRLLVILPAAILVVGWACLAGHSAGWYDARFSMALMIVFSMALAVAAVGTTATSLARVDLARRSALAELMRLNAELEGRVAERARELGEVSESLMSANRTLQHLSFHDALTDLANRRNFDAYLASQMGVARREGRSLAMVMCDVDTFKAFNDAYGHPAGDDCLRRVAAALRSCCRRPGDMAVRYGGEEFALVLPETDLAGAVLIAEAALEAVASLKIQHPGSAAATPWVSICCGVAVMDRPDMTVEALITAADENLFRAKNAGRNCVVATPG